MEVALLPLAASFPPQTKLKETIPSLLAISSPSIMPGVGINANLTCQVDPGGSASHLNSNLQKSLIGQSEKNHDNRQPFFRGKSDDEGPAFKLEELRHQQEWEEALLMMDNWLQQGGPVLASDLASLLQHCGDMHTLAKAYQAHQYIIMSGHVFNVFLTNTLIEVYSKCGNLIDSCMVFNNMCRRNVFSWTAIILAHVKDDQATIAILLFIEMLATGVVPDKVLFVVILKACANLMVPEKGWEVHAYTVEYGFDSDSHVGSTLIFMHVELGNLHYAHIVFDKIKEPSVVAWNTLIMGYAEEGFSRKAFSLFRKMQDATAVDDITFLSILKACTGFEYLCDGMEVHAHAIANGLDLHLFVGSSLVDMYAKCGSIEYAYALFNKLEVRNVVSWTAMITGFAQQGTWDLVLNLFKQMHLENSAQPNELTYASVLCACSGLALERKGREMHANIVRCGYEFDVFICSTLIDMYANCGFMDDAFYIFNSHSTPNVVMYNSLLAGYAQQGLGEEALELFESMEREGLKPDEVTFASILKTCSLMEALEHGKDIHDRILKYGLEQDAVIASSLVSVYAKCGSMNDSQNIFDGMQQRDVVSWNALIAGYASHGPGQESLTLLDRMWHDGFEPNKSTYVSVFKSCASLAALEHGRNVLMRLVKTGIDSDLLLNSTLVDFFAKCGCLDDADYVFQNMPEHDVVSWTAMIIACAQQGFAKDAVLLYERMKHEGVVPNEVTFVGVLNACSHAGLVQEALQYFKSMRDVYGITPTANHCACLIDLLGRAGHLVEAADLMKHLPTDTDEVSWLALLGACRRSSDVEIARHAVDQVLEQNSNIGSAYVLLSNISAT